jgi:hypothetical protein
MRENEEGEQERRQQRALAMAMSIADDLRKVVSAKRSQVVLTRCEELTRLVRELSAGLR